MGHIRALEESLDAIGIDRGFQKPTYRWLKEKAKAIQALKAAAATEKGPVYLAADDDREGEMIAYSVAQLLKLPADAPRVVFHEITETAIRHAIAHPRTMDMNRVHAQQARAMLDLLIGFTLSPLLWKHVAPSLSAGRCQTPALRLVIEKEHAIEAFVAQRSWRATAQWTPEDEKETVDTTLQDELEDEASALALLEHAHHTTSGTLHAKDIRPWSEAPPPPLITSTLQQQASAMYHCSPKQTMSVAQRLYEAGLITYMRTDKATLSEEARNQAREWVQANWGAEYLAEAKPVEPRRIARPRTAKTPPPKAPQAQEAHEAIRPTHLEQTTLGAPWGPTERRIYELISRRALQSVMAAAYGERCRLTIHLDGLEDFPWISEQKRTQFPGWKVLGTVKRLDDQEQEQDQKAEDQKDEKDAAWRYEPGQRFTWQAIHAYEAETTRPPRYTEATLVCALEQHGIGRPSTFAALLAVLQEKGYATLQDIPATPLTTLHHALTPNQWPPLRTQKTEQRGGEKRKLQPTALGRSVWEWLAPRFDDLFRYAFTAEMERQLDQIAAGHADATALLTQTWGAYQERYQTFNTQQSQQQQSKQRTFSNGLKAVQTKKGPLLLREQPPEPPIFYGWPEGVSWEKLTEDIATLFLQQKTQDLQPIGQWNGQPIYRRSGPFGLYLEAAGQRIPFQPDESLEDTQARFDQRHQAPKAVLHETQHYQAREGPYGPYLMKRSNTKKKVFASLPKGFDLTTLPTLKDADMKALYELGLASKAKSRPIQKTQQTQQKDPQE